MRLGLTIIICKISRLLLKLIGRGSSMPGKIALKLYPDVLSRIHLPKYIIAVTGSNGKTSTVEMINTVLQNSSLTVAYNSEGSNQIDGVATLVLNNCDLKGNFKKDVLLLESDERYAQYSFKYFAPTHYVITNLYRDQMTRNGHPEFVINEIKKSIKKNSILILNGDDPIINNLGYEYKNEKYYFGIGKNSYTSKKNDFIYDDGVYCPRCNKKLIYDYHVFGHVGKYHCSKCSFKRNVADYEITKVDLDKRYILINKKSQINLAFNSMYNAYNVLAAYSVCRLLNVNESIICNSLNNYLLKNGRVKQFKLNNKKGTLLISKHENSVSYNQNIKYVCDYKNNATVFLMVDAISRKYFTSETSWLWDINFDSLKSNNVKKIIVTGQYSSDIMERLEYTDIDTKKIYVNPNINEAIEYTRKRAVGHIFVLTCFSDEFKFMNEVDHEDN